MERSSPFPPLTTVDKPAVKPLWLKPTIKLHEANKAAGSRQISHWHRQVKIALVVSILGGQKNTLHLFHKLLQLWLLAAWCQFSWKTETKCGRKQNTIVTVGGNYVCVWRNLGLKLSLQQLSDFGVNSSDKLKSSNVEHVQAAMSRQWEKRGIKKLTLHTFYQRVQCTRMHPRRMAVLGNAVA